jgi:hypothetical protein
MALTIYYTITVPCILLIVTTITRQCSCVLLPRLCSHSPSGSPQAFRSYHLWDAHLSSLGGSWRVRLVASWIAILFLASQS